MCVSIIRLRQRAQFTFRQCYSRIRDSVRCALHVCIIIIKLRQRAHVPTVLFAIQFIAVCCPLIVEDCHSRKEFVVRENQVRLYSLASDCVRNDLFHDVRMCKSSTVSMRVFHYVAPSIPIHIPPLLSLSTEHSYNAHCRTKRPKTRTK